jgi:hypothetical protein
LDLRGPDAIPAKGKADDNIMVQDIMADIEQREKEGEKYDKRYLEAGEEYAASSRRGSIAQKVVRKGRGSINEQLLDDQEEDYDYDFGDEHFHKGSIY